MKQENVPHRIAESGAEESSPPSAASRLSALRLGDEERATPPRRWPWLLVLVPMLLLAVLFGPRLDLPFLRPRVDTATVRQVTPTQSQTVLTASGYTYARTRAAVGSKIIGRVVELPVDEGDRVRRGDLIAVLDSDDLRAALAQSQAQVAEARARLIDAEREEGRQRRLVEAEVAPQAELDAAETRAAVMRAALETAQARLRSIEAQLAYTVISSPIDGVIIQRNVEVGEMVAPGGFTSQQSTGAIVRIADPTSLEVEADINESYISRLKPGQPATIKVDAVPDREYHGRLRQIVPTADRQRAVVEVKVTVDDRDDRLVPDMSSTVTFLEVGTDEHVLAGEPKLMIPASAVLDQDGQSVVYRIVDDTLRKAFVEVAPTSDAASVEVLAGLEAGEVVVRSPEPGMADGRKVRVE